METFGLIGLIQMECDGSDVRTRRIHGSGQILCCRVYLALINAVTLYTQLAAPDHKTRCLQLGHSNPGRAVSTRAARPLQQDQGHQRTGPEPQRPAVLVGAGAQGGSWVPPLGGWAGRRARAKPLRAVQLGSRGPHGTSSPFLKRSFRRRLWLCPSNLQHPEGS